MDGWIVDLDGWMVACFKLLDGWLDGLIFGSLINWISLLMVRWLVGWIVG